MEILFLDVDGVLNSSRFAHARHKKWVAAGRPQPHKMIIPMDPDAIELLSTLFDERPELSTVVSSTWRHYHTLEELREMLPRMRVISKTPACTDPDLHNEMDRRDTHILLWLKRNPEITNWAVVDDDMWDQGKIIEMGRFVKTSWEGGITPKHLKKIKNILETQND